MFGTNGRDHPPYQRISALPRYQIPTANTYKTTISLTIEHEPVAAAFDLPDRYHQPTRSPLSRAKNALKMALFGPVDAHNLTTTQKPVICQFEKMFDS